MTLAFSELWEQAEQIKSNESREEIHFNLIELLNDYKKLDNIVAKDIQKTLRVKKYGEILYKMTELSRMDEINTYAALLLELQFLQKKD